MIAAGPMRGASDSDRIGIIAAIAAAVMIAVQVASKATRDALFLSNFNIDQLPAMLVAAAVFSLIGLLWVSRAMQRLTPGRLIPVFFGVSSALLVVEWVLLGRFERLASVLVYLHIAAFGSFLVSGFWSIVNERFDPRTAKRKVGLIAGGGTLGGLLGGLGAERVAALATVSTMLPLMASMHLICGVLVHRMRFPGERKAGRSSLPDSRTFAGVDAVRRTPYLRNIAGLILVTTISATLLDYVFKAQAFASYDQGELLMRYFAIFYAAVSLLTFLLQTLLGRISLEKLGLAGTIVLLPVTVALGGAAMLLVPGLGLAGIVRGSEAALRSSLFRSGYELLYTPVPVQQKRPAKSIIDVGFDRLADAFGALVIRMLLWLVPGGAVPALLGTSLLLAGVAVALASRLHQGYVNALKHRLVDRAEELDMPEFRGDPADSIVMRTLDSIDLRRVLGRSSEGSVSDGGSTRSVRAPQPPGQDPVVEGLADLRSGSVERVRHRLRLGLDATLTGQAIDLLAWNAVSDAAIESLRNLSGTIVGQLTDRLLDPLSDFAVRRRIPRILAVCDSPRAVAGLIEGLSDHRFEVRYQCAAGLARIRERQLEIAIPEDRVRQSVLHELDVDGSGWANRRLLDADEARPSDALLADRANLSLEHVFRLLALIYEREPLQIALQGLYTDDPQLRGTALEYLESVLPPKILGALWPFLEGPPLRPTRLARNAAPEVGATAKRDPRTELLMSQSSIEVNLSRLRKKS